MTELELIQDVNREKKKKQNDPRDFEFVNAYERQLFSKGEE